VDESVEWRDAALSLAAPDHLAAAHVPGVEVGDGAHPLVLVLDELTQRRPPVLMPAFDVRRLGCTTPARIRSRKLCIGGAMQAV